MWVESRKSSWEDTQKRQEWQFFHEAAAAAKLLQLCPTLWDPIDGIPPGSPVPEILQARTLEWVAISFSSAWKWKMKAKSLSRVRLLVTPWTVPIRLLCPWDFSGKSTGVGCHCLLIEELKRKLVKYLGARNKGRTKCWSFESLQVMLWTQVLVSTFRELEYCILSGDRRLGPWKQWSWNWNLKTKQIPWKTRRNSPTWGRETVKEFVHISLDSGWYDLLN